MRRLSTLSSLRSAFFHDVRTPRRSDERVDGCSGKRQLERGIRDGGVRAVAPLTGRFMFARSHVGDLGAFSLGAAGKECL